MEQVTPAMTRLLDYGALGIFVILLVAACVVLFVRLNRSQDSRIAEGKQHAEDLHKVVDRVDDLKLVIDSALAALAAQQTRRKL